MIPVEKKLWIKTYEGSGDVHKLRDFWINFYDYFWYKFNYFKNSSEDFKPQNDCWHSWRTIPVSAKGEQKKHKSQ